ncbi:MAG TPA: tRNA (adenosine(37)-N6)-threonylcarbamoyltransferase complex transferase subunit TsaD [Syntrophales bacterium]|nr:tRNA (adenosine(37)-N6)-threonylcarbamoyltransferase complex transferase subunit TsaD [Syntrophales bacterium]HRV42781.1 tRNA (adenosine(37)-N6)-threonylcarbamoyltransferase complex transferase subunit TsaD [Syntrophales bacterium]
MIVLGIESSCDETAAAVVRDGTVILSNVVASQIEVHGPYGGVVPEIASRKHIEAIGFVIREALDKAEVDRHDIEGIAVTRGPGLVGSLLVGLSMAKALAYALGIPLVGVNHLVGHMAAVFLGRDRPAFPFVCLIVSGGHTTLCAVRDFEDVSVLGQTRDDAAGEAFDKAAKLLGIGYPGGIVIDRLARRGDGRVVPFPRAMRQSLDFSFSGLKTSLVNLLKRRACPFTEDELPDVAASYQEAVVEVLVEKTLRAAEETAMERVVVCGGVAANSRLRDLFAERAAVSGVRVYIPPADLCTDNAAMVAAAGDYLLRKGRRDGLDLNALSRWPLGLAL